MRLLLLVLTILGGASQIRGQALTVVEDAEVETVDDVTIDAKVGSGKIFVPTEEWQEILEGEMIPAGIHVRMNLETGKREGKLMDKETRDAEEKKRQGWKRVDNLGQLERDSTSEKKRNFSQESKLLQEKLDNFMKENKVKVSTDFQQIEFLIENFDNSSQSDKILILEDLEFLLHQYDNARDFVTAGGLEKVADFGLALSDEDITDKILLMLGAAFQSQPEVQSLAANRPSGGWIEKLLKMFDEAKSARVQKRSVYALGNLVRGNNENIILLVENDGVQRMMSHLPEIDANNQMKVMSLVADILARIERDDSFSNEIFTGSRDAICGNVHQTLTELLQTPMNDYSHSVIRSSSSLVTTCQNQWTNDVISGISAALETKKIQISAKLEQEDDLDLKEGLQESLELTSGVLSLLNRSKDEL